MMKLLAPYWDKRYKMYNIWKDEEGVISDREGVFFHSYTEENGNIYWKPYMPGSHLDISKSDSGEHIATIVGDIPYKLLLCNVYAVRDSVARKMIKDEEAMLIEFYEDMYIIPLNIRSGNNLSPLKENESYSNLIYTK